MCPRSSERPASSGIKDDDGCLQAGDIITATDLHLGDRGFNLSFAALVKPSYL
jgi:hypothetical protein